MPPSDEYVISRACAIYHHADQMKRDVLNALRHYNGLSPKFSKFVFNDGSEKELLNLDGTIPVPYKGNTYNIPVIIWLLQTHPYNPPMCFVKPTSNMQIKVSHHVDQTGKIYLPYLHEWKPTSSDLLGLIQVLIIVFGEQPPVYSTSSPTPKVTAQQYYPNYQGYMPMPSAGNASQQTSFPPYLGANTSAATTAYPAAQYPPYSSSSSYPMSGGYSQYPPHPVSSSSYSNTGYPPSSSTGNAYPPPAVGYPPSSTSGGYPPYPQTNQVALQSREQNTEKEDRLIQLSAVEHKLRQKFDETFLQYQAEIDVLKKTGTDLKNGQNRIQEIRRKLDEEHRQLDNGIRVLKEKDEEMKGVLLKIDEQEDIDVDEAVTTTAPLYKQLFQLYAEENATQDAIYYLGEGLRRNVIDLDVFLKHVRELSRKQFILRATMQKCREKAGLHY